MNAKTCATCKIEKHINKFYKRLSECEDCNRARAWNVTMKTKR